MAWEEAKSTGKNFKVFIFGPPGCWKTRLMLRLGNVHPGVAPALAVMDTEFGTGHYADEFRFARKQEVDADVIEKEIDALIAKPGSIRAIGLDSYTVYDKALVNKWVELYHKRLLTSSGHKAEFYVLQPNDHQNINRERDKFIRKLLKSGLHVYMTAEVKNQWAGMKIIGKTFDAPERFTHFFDTVIEVQDRGPNTIGFLAKVLKDRTHNLRQDKIYEWDSEEQAYALLKNFDLSGAIPAAKAEAKPAPQVKPEAPEQPTAEPATDTPPFDPAPQPAAQPEAPAPTLDDVVRLKKGLGILDRKAWDDLLVPYNVKTAKDLDQQQLKAFVAKLESMRPTPGQRG
jgi:hypothetical protein